MRAYWINRNGRVSGLVTYDSYGNPKELGLADVMGRFSVEQISAMRASLPVVEG